MAEAFKNRERAQDFYLDSVELDLAREGSKTELKQEEENPVHSGKSDIAQSDAA